MRESIVDNAPDGLEAISVISEPLEHARFKTSDAYSAAYRIECGTCGFEPENQLSIRFARCPKCYAFTWQRVPRPGGPLEPEDRRARHPALHATDHSGHRFAWAKSGSLP